MRDLYCTYCKEQGKLELFIETKETLKAHIDGQICTAGVDIPTFTLSVEDGEDQDASFIEYTPFFKCTVCHKRPYIAEFGLEYDEINDLLIFPTYKEDALEGYAYNAPTYPIVTSAIKPENDLSSFYELEYGMGAGTPPISASPVDEVLLTIVRPKKVSDVVAAD